MITLVRTLRQSMTIPLFLKLHREYTSVSNLARQLVFGVQGLVLYARDPEIDISLDDCKLKVDWGLSPPGSISPSLRSLMSVYGQCPAMPLAGSGGIAKPQDVIKMLLAGADAAVIVSAIYREGPDVIRKMNDRLIQFLRSNRLSSVNELQSRRPLEFSPDMERLQVLSGLTERPPAISNHAIDPFIQSDVFGHAVLTV